ncbi:hypothetical protein SAMN04488012_10575 [Palleronia salina]|uniref:Uncharacterized protein n=1 Tax=Palleronia salina TaxID=313368 RepID=A0A1M6GSV7_9RHOB|nr:hypothetical protein [Palleronia salina]SHJ13043.1 hypothetical protein SAMN04488012_10575 [Palleronia salina]
MAERRTIQKDDIDTVIGIIKSFRKKPTWDAITDRVKEAGLPFQKRALQNQKRIKAAYDEKLETVRIRRAVHAERRARVGLPRSESDLMELVEKNQRRITELEAELQQRNLELAFLTQRCRRENIELGEINRPLKPPKKI